MPADVRVFNEIECTFDGPALITAQEGAWDRIDRGERQRIATRSSSS